MIMRFWMANCVTCCCVSPMSWRAPVPAAASWGARAAACAVGRGCRNDFFDHHRTFDFNNPFNGNFPDDLDDLHRRAVGSHHRGLLVVAAQAGGKRERGGEEKKSDRVRAPGPELVQGDVFRDVSHVGSLSGFAPVLPGDGTSSLIFGGGSPPEVGSQLDNTRGWTKTFHAKT